MAPQGIFQKAGVEQRRQSIVKLEAHGRSPFLDQPGRWNPLPRRSMARSHMPQGGDVTLAAACFSHHLLTDQQAEFNSDSGKADSLAADFRTCRDVVVAGQVPTLHPGAVVYRCQSALGGVGCEADL